MESSAQPTGFAYLCSYPGALNIVQELLNLTVIIYLLVVGVSTSANLLAAVTAISTGLTAVFVIIHIRGVVRQSKLPWHWIECLTSLCIAITLAIFAAFVLSGWTRDYIIIGILGFTSATVYFFDTFYRYQMAVKPTARYAWTTPNMPDIN